MRANWARTRGAAKKAGSAKLSSRPPYALAWGFKIFKSKNFLNVLGCSDRDLRILRGTGKGKEGKRKERSRKSSPLVVIRTHNLRAVAKFFAAVLQPLPQLFQMISVFLWFLRLREELPGIFLCSFILSYNQYPIPLGDCAPFSWLLFKDGNFVVQVWVRLLRRRGWNRTRELGPERRLRRRRSQVNPAASKHNIWSIQPSWNLYTILSCSP